MPISRPYTQPNDESSRVPSRARASGRESSPRTWQHSLEFRRSETELQDDTSEMVDPRWSGRISPTETRRELIERIKRDNTYLRHGEHRQLHKDEEDVFKNTTTERAHSKHAEETEKMVLGKLENESLQAGLTIERPRSALHRGDFRDDDPSNQRSQADSPRPKSFLRGGAAFGTSPTSPWYTPTFARNESFSGIEQHRGGEAIPQIRTRAASYTARSTGFTFLPPTSPLANETNNTDSERERSRSPEKTARRRTFSPSTFSTLQSDSLYQWPSGLNNRPLPNVRREGNFPYQAHQPRRSVSSLTEDVSTPQTLSARSRRPSQASAASPLQRAPMIGGYEESILRGRMSTLPSRPLDFVAQIGVLGKGNCRSNLRCPPHITVPFPAVFYNYGTRPGSPTKDGPSPYVGVIELERLSSATALQQNAARSRSPSPVKVTSGINDHTQAQSSLGRPRRSSHRKESKRVPRGSYRIPQQGQLQIIIKNPNKTAVKLFLVPYDLTGMEAGQRTFVRQRSYSAGPIIDMPITARHNLGTDRPEAAICNSDDPKDRPVLRYLIHLNMCCPSKGRFYLYKSIRVVFANRVPDGKEKLRQEIQLPEPRFSHYKPEPDHKYDPLPFDKEDFGLPPPGRFSFDSNYRSTSREPQSNDANTRGMPVSPNSTYSALLTTATTPPVADFTNYSTRKSYAPFSFPFTSLHSSLQETQTHPEMTQIPDGNTTTDEFDASLHSSIPTDLPRMTRGARGMDSALTPWGRPSRHANALLASPDLDSPGRSRFERIERDVDTIAGGAPGQRRPQSPRPGEGLLSFHFRDLAYQGSEESP